MYFSSSYTSTSAPQLSADSLLFYNAGGGQNMDSTDFEKWAMMEDTEGIIRHIMHLESNEEKTACCLKVLTSLDLGKDGLFERMNMVFKLLISNPQWWQSIYTKDSLDARLQHIRESLEANIPRIRKRRDERIRYIKARWEEHHGVCAWIEEEEQSSNFLYHLARVAKKFPNFNDARDRLNDAFVQRLLISKKGTRKEKRLQGSDCERALNLESVQQHSRTVITCLNLSANQKTGLLGLLGHGSILDQDFDSSSILQIGSPTLLDTSNGNAQTSMTASQRAEEQFRALGAEPYDLNEIYSPDPVPESRSESDDFNSEYSRTREGSLETQISSTEAYSSEDSMVSSFSQTEMLTRRRRPCQCRTPLSKPLARMYREYKWKHLTTSMAQNVNEMLRNLVRNLGQLCGRHVRYIAVLSGLKVKSIKRPELMKRMEILNAATLAGEKALKELKKTKSGFWFTKNHRLEKKTDILGHYKFARQTEWPSKKIQNRLFDPIFLESTLSFLLSKETTGVDMDYSRLLNDWSGKGSANFPLFKWWWSMNGGGIARIIDEDLDMYKHHTRQNLHGYENKGWLPTAFYSIAQQLACQDPVQYAVYVALRPDHYTSLMSYPGYAKYSEFDEEHPTTGGFEHIDQNVEKLLDKSLNVHAQIQGTISLDDESPLNCTKISPGFHKPGVLENYWKALPEEKRRNGPNTRIPCSAVSHMKWEAVPCKQGEARITMPQIPHGAQPRYEGMGRRRTVLPWLSRVADDQTTLPNTDRGAGTVQDIILARVACMPPKTEQSGKPIWNSHVPYKFPPSVRLESLGALSDALIGLRPWDSPEVIEEQEILFGRDRVKAQKFIKEWRLKAYDATQKAFGIIKKTEQKVFGSRSFWNVEAVGYPFESEDSNLSTTEDDGLSGQSGSEG